MRDDLIESQCADILTTQVANTNDRDIAIIGMDCNFPGGYGLENFWQSLLQGKNSVKEAPNERWDSSAYFDPDNKVFSAMNTNKGGFIESIDNFDADFFGISAAEAEHMDPQQRLLLQTSWTALENSGVTPSEIEGTLTGVFIGSCSHEFSLLAWAEASSIYTGTGTSNSLLANRLSYHLKLNGPSISVDTACSSSLVALHLATNSLISGECDYAIVGGANLMATPMVTVGLSRAGMISTLGECRSFGNSAEGYVRGEGVGVIVLMRAVDAIKRQLPVVCLIRGSAVNHNGKANGLTAPNPASQASLIKQAYKAAGLFCTDVNYLEAAATGTQYGDAIEMKAISETFLHGRPKDSPLLIGSVKSNIGHLEGAAGIAAIIKTALVLKNGIAPKNLHSETLNPLISAIKGSFIIPQDVVPLAGKFPLLGAVSSFGFGGTNAHIVLSSFNEKKSFNKNFDREKIILFSAKNDVRLKELIEIHLRKLDSDKSIDLDCFSYSVNTGREQFSHRLAVKYSTRENLMEQLQTGRYSAALSTNMHRFVLSLGGGCIKHWNVIKSLCSFSNSLLFQFNELFESLNGFTINSKPTNLDFSEINRNSFLLEKDSCLQKENNSFLLIVFVVEYCFAKWMTTVFKNIEGFSSSGMGVLVALCVVDKIKIIDAVNWLYGKILASDIALLNDNVITNASLNCGSYCNLNGEPLDVLINNISVKPNKWLARSPIILLDAQTEYSGDVFLDVKQSSELRGTQKVHPVFFNEIGCFEDFIVSIFRDGAQLNFHQYYSSDRYTYIPTPNYPFERKKYWPDNESFRAHKTPSNISGALIVDFLGKRILTSLGNEIYYDYVLNDKNSKFIRDHIILEKNILSASTQVSMVLACLKDLSLAKSIVLEGLEFSGQILIPSGMNLNLQLVIVPHEDKNSGEVCMLVRAHNNNQSWDKVFNCSYFFEVKISKNFSNKIDIFSESIPGFLEKQRFFPLDTEFYRDLHGAGYHFGRSFQYLKSRNELHSSLFELHCDKKLENRIIPLFPGTLDAAFQSLILVVEKKFYKEELISIPIFIKSLQFSVDGNASDFNFSYVVSSRQEGHDLYANFSILNKDFDTLMQLDGVKFKSFPKSEIVKYWNGVESQYYQKDSEELNLSYKNSVESFLMLLLKRILGKEFDLQEMEEPMIMLGFDSLKSMEVRGLVKKYFMVDVSVAEIMAGMSANELLALIKGFGKNQDNVIILDVENENVLSRISFSDESAIDTKIMETEI